jgi:hypothetical protein
MDVTQKKQPPCREEYVAAGYSAEGYEQCFAGNEWGPTWSDPKWVPPVIALEGLPTCLVVRSQVRKAGSRVLRRQQPTRHRFKQYLFGDPSKRVLRSKPVLITSNELQQHFEELHSKEATGILAVHTLDGRRLNLAMLRDGVLALASRASTLPPMAPLLDSIANDIPAGIPLPQYEGGTFHGDPAADRTLERLEAEKRAEGVRQGALEEPAEPETAETVEPLAATTEFSFEADDFPSEPPPPPSVAFTEGVPVAADPAAHRAGKKKHKR